jgi:hypothetical protein
MSPRGGPGVLRFFGANNVYGNKLARGLFGTLLAISEVRSKPTRFNHMVLPCCEMAVTFLQLNLLNEVRTR